MADPSDGTESTNAPAKTKIPQSPGGKAMGPFGIGFITVYFAAIAILVGNGLIVLWPPGPPATATPPAISAGGAAPVPAPSICKDPKQPFELFWRYHFCLSDEQRLLLLIVFAGALGALVHCLRSFFWYVGNRQLVSSWAGMYITLPLLGAAIATVFYLIIRGGFFPQAKSSDTSPMSFVAVAALIGMFTEQAAQKLKDVAETFFAPAPKGADHAGAPTLTKVEPNHGGVDSEVTISGTGFVEKTTVKFGKTVATSVTFVSSTSIKVKSPAGETGTVAVEVANPDGLKATMDKGYTYE